MITSVEFNNFRSLRDAILPLERCTLIVGPNGSGKSTALKALTLLKDPSRTRYSEIVSTGSNAAESVEIKVNFSGAYENLCYRCRWTSQNDWDFGFRRKPNLTEVISDVPYELKQLPKDVTIYALQPEKIAEPCPLTTSASLGSDGSNLVVVLDQLRDNHPERFQTLNTSLNQWLPEFDHILFDTPTKGVRALRLRTTKGKHALSAANLSDGTLFVLTILTLSYLPDLPKVICLEEPDRGIHPRLLKDVQEALYRLSYPEYFGEDREPVQVIATTHSPYLLDLFRDHPEQIVIANKTAEGNKFEQLSKQPYIEEILQDASLGEIWYTGILGGVPAGV